MIQYYPLTPILMITSEQLNERGTIDIYKTDSWMPFQSFLLIIPINHHQQIVVIHLKDQVATTDQPRIFPTDSLLDNNWICATKKNLGSWVLPSFLVIQHLFFCQLLSPPTSWLWGQTHVNLKNRWSYTEYCYFSLFSLNPCPLFPTHTHLTTGRGSIFCMTIGDGHLALLVSVRVDSSVLGQNRSKETNYVYIYKNGKLFDSLNTVFFQHFARHNAIKLSSCSVKKNLPQQLGNPACRNTQLGPKSTITLLQFYEKGRNPHPIFPRHPGSNTTSISFTRSTSWLLSALAF